MPYPETSSWKTVSHQAACNEEHPLNGEKCVLPLGHRTLGHQTRRYSLNRQSWWMCDGQGRLSHG